MNKPQIGDMAYWFSKDKLVSSKIKGVYPECVITKNEDVLPIENAHTSKIEAIEKMQELLLRLLESEK